MVLAGKEKVILFPVATRWYLHSQPSDKPCSCTQTEVSLLQKQRRVLQFSAEKLNITRTYKPSRDQVLNSRTAAPKRREARSGSRGRLSHTHTNEADRGRKPAAHFQSATQIPEQTRKPGSPWLFEWHFYVSKKAQGYGGVSLFGFASTKCIFIIKRGRNFFV